MPRGTGGSAIARSRRVSPAKKAQVHQEEGAGASRIIRKFFGLSGAEQNVLADHAWKRVRSNITRYR